jgi:hypothetical protein
MVCIDGSSSPPQPDPKRKSKQRPRHRLSSTRQNGNRSHQLSLFSELPTAPRERIYPLAAPIRWTGDDQ